MSNLLIGNEAFRVEVAGDAARPALMLSNALGTDLSMWDGQMAALTKHFRVVRYDTRGHGGSHLGDALPSMARLGQDAIAILDALEIESAHWLGLSMGGAIGLWLLSHAPGRIARAVLANTAPRLGSPEAWNARILAVLRQGMAENADTTIARWFSPAFAEREPEAVGRIHDMLRHVSPEGYAACCAALRDTDLRGTLGDIAHEVLVISGSDDASVPKADVEAFVKGIAGARHVALAARHMSNIEAQAAFTKAVVEFLTAKPAAKAKPKARAKAPPAAAPVAKRTGAARRSNTARSPLAKDPAEGAATKKSTSKAGAPAKKSTKATDPRRRPATKTSSARPGPGKAAAAKTQTAKTRAAKTRAAKAPTKSPAARTAATKAGAKKSTRNAPSTRRATPLAAARVTTKKAKAKTAAKKPAKKTGARVTKKMPLGRRPSAKTPRRPGGGRKR